jgi:hypothetical protein
MSLKHNYTKHFFTKNINTVDEFRFAIRVGKYHMETVCHIEIIKDGRDFVARAHMANGSIKEYRHHVFEDVLTEMVIDLQEELAE